MGGRRRTAGLGALGGVVVAAILVLLAALGAGAGGEPEDLLPYRSPLWVYQITPSGGCLPPLPAPCVGSAPFATPGIEGCGLPPPATVWPANTRLTAYHHVVIPPGTTDVVVHFGIDNDVRVFVNLQPLITVVHEECAKLDEFNAPVPPAFLLPGPNLVHAEATDRGGATFFDLRVSGLTP